MSIRLDLGLALIALTALNVMSPAAGMAAPAQGRCGAAYAPASRARQAADVAIRRGDFHAANSQLDGGLRALGTAYATGDMIDDTGMHLALARVQESKRQFKQAATGKRAVLDERLRLCSGR